MSHVPAKLINALKTLGLFESEAKVYSALVLMKYAQAKDLVDYLDISKPSVYESLRTLEDKGLVVMTNSKPVTYQPIPPEIAIKMLKDTFEEASIVAEVELLALEREKVQGKPDVVLWSLFGRETIDYKIEDMLKHASSSVECIMPERYLHYLEDLAGKGLSLNLLVISDDPGMQRALENMFQGDKARIRVLNSDMLGALFTRYKLGVAKPETQETFLEAMKTIDLKNLLILTTDGSELLYIMPIVDGEDSALNSTNKGVIALMNAFFSTYGNLL